MSDDFICEIKNYEEPLFYNSKGSTEAYKLCVRHLSSALNAGLAKLSNGYMIPNNLLHIVNLENETIEVVSDKIKLVKLETLK
ncbi:MAG: Unknown protein [uncultured Sulfurovum sp.]|uniref:Uncharacterized protein n=1 Tax=uncultured Sulfurovum sp. TaxID=269237 RepID=A0A6S6SZS4_9BACT|nr:MAG: Unknown protein [uncultured Sulfurovum sp.]